MKKRNIIWKATSVILAFTLCVTAFTGCGKKKSAEDAIEEAKKIDKNCIFKEESYENILRIVGYIYASRFAQRAAYGWAAGTSIYIDQDYHRRGIGKLLYEKLEAILKLQNITNLYAGAADPMDEEDPYLTRNSEHFHEAIGYKTVARYHGCGSKFGRWYNLLWMEKIINEHSVPPKEVTPFSELDVNAVQAILES